MRFGKKNMTWLLGFKIKHKIVLKCGVLQLTASKTQEAEVPMSVEPMKNLLCFTLATSFQVQSLIAFF